jgi:hypothetical protein
VALMVVLTPVAEVQVPLAPAALSELARFGVSRVALARDGHTLAFVIEGWAFDPSRSADAVIAAVAAGASSPQTLLPLAEMALTGDQPS